jgi:hypothetical protein
MLWLMKRMLFLFVRHNVGVIWQSIVLFRTSPFLLHDGVLYLLNELHFLSDKC